MHIYLPLLSECTEVWRPVKARPINDETYEIISVPDYASLHEEWQFPPGNMVKCAYESHPGKKCLVAQEQA